MSDIDFSNVMATWYRFSHNGPTGAQPANAGELTAWQLDAANNRIVATDNSVSVIGFISPYAYENYIYEVELSSVDADDDMIGLVIGFTTEADGREHTLTVNRSAGGTGGGLFCATVDYVWSTPADRLIFSSSTNLTSYVGTGGWGNKKCRIKVIRTGDTFVIHTTDLYAGGPTAYVNTQSIDLNSHVLLGQFKGPSNVGYVCLSQRNSTWLVIDQPLGDPIAYPAIPNGNISITMAGTYLSMSSRDLTTLGDAALLTAPDGSMSLGDFSNYTLPNIEVSSVTVNRASLVKPNTMPLRVSFDMNKPLGVPATFTYLTVDQTAQSLTATIDNLAYDSEGNSFISALDDTQGGRVVLDGGFPKFYNDRWDASGDTWRYITNVYNWIKDRNRPANILLLGDLTSTTANYNVNSADDRGFKTSFTNWAVTQSLGITIIDGTSPLATDLGGGKWTVPISVLSQFSAIFVVGSMYNDVAGRVWTDDFASNIYQYVQTGGGLFITTDHGSDAFSHLETFEDGATGWSNNSTVTSSGSLGTFLGLFGGEAISGTISKTFDFGVEAANNSVTFEFDGYFIDSWDNETLELRINNVLVNTTTYAFSIDSADYTTPTDEFYGWEGEGVKHYTFTVALNNAGKFDFSFKTTTNHPVEDESFGLDNVKITHVAGAFYNNVNLLANKFGARFWGNVNRSPVEVSYLIANYGNHPLWDGLTSVYAGASECNIDISVASIALDPDFHAAGGTFIMPAGNTTGYIDIDIYAGTGGVPSEQFDINFLSPARCTIINTKRCTIISS